MLDHYRFGIEEEYFVSSARTRHAAKAVPRAS